MNPQNSPQTESRPEWYDPFPEPRTVPTGWAWSEDVREDDSTWYLTEDQGNYSED